MGQLLFHPPNVRGWVGGRLWINSSTLTARRQLVDLLFSPIDENPLNADEHLELVAARTNGHDRFTVGDAPFSPLAGRAPDDAAATLARTYLPPAGVAPSVATLTPFLAAGATPAARLPRLRRACVSLMQSPEYQLC